MASRLVARAGLIRPQSIKRIEEDGKQWSEFSLGRTEGERVAVLETRRASQIVTTWIRIFLLKRGKRRIRVSKAD